MKSFFFAALLLTQISWAQTTTPEIEKICSTVNPAVCAEMQFLTPISSTQPGEFMIHIIAPDEATVTQFKASLWMSMGNHGHGSAPLKITPLEQNQFHVKNAHFVMMGTWQIRLDFLIGAEAHHLEFTVDVAQ